VGKKMAQRIRYRLPEKGLIKAAMPRVIKPMLALYGKLPDEQKLYGFEYKWDGVRAIYFWDGNKAFLQSRNLLDITAVYPEIKSLGLAFGSKAVVLDGEIIALDERGRPSFNRLEHRFGIADPAEAMERAKLIPVVYMVFDVLYFEQHLLFEVPYVQRRKLLDSFGLAGQAWQVPPWTAEEGTAMLEAAATLKLEGVVAKRLDSVYEQDKRSGEWIKTKLVMRQEFVIGGWTPLKGRNVHIIGALLVGYYRKGRLIFAGSVGTGFTDEQRKNLGELCRKNRLSKNPFNGPKPRPDAVYCEPKFVAEVAFHGWTDHEILRQASFKGLRDDKNPEQVVREDYT
jgi:bifunctional non-homologous end joining protein LigD